jgi:predicted HAD superfamily Cof-like phosphohydrolase
VSFFDDVMAFHQKFNLRVRLVPQLTDETDRLLRQDLVAEEMEELYMAHMRMDIVGIADAIADAIYVLCGMAVAYGIPLNDVWNEVHRTNMTKEGENGPIYRADGKVLKPDSWKPPDIEGIISARRQH